MSLDKKRGEIREGIAKIVVAHPSQPITAAKEILSYLHSQKCRIEVERELPVNKYNSPENYEHEVGFFSTHEMYDIAQQDMLKWHRDSLEPLIKGDKLIGN